MTDVPDTTRDEIVTLLREIVNQHADPEAPEYNDCDNVACNWCARAKRIVQELTDTSRNEMKI